MEIFTNDRMRDKMIYAVEILENMREDNEIYSKALLSLYIFSMGKYNAENEDLTVFERRNEANRMLNEISSVAFLCHNLNKKLGRFPDLAVPDCPDPS